MNEHDTESTNPEINKTFSKQFVLGYRAESIRCMQ